MCFQVNWWTARNHLRWPVSVAARFIEGGSEDTRIFKSWVIEAVSPSGRCVPDSMGWLRMARRARAIRLMNVTVSLLAMQEGTKVDSQKQGISIAASAGGAKKVRRRRWWAMVVL